MKRICLASMLVFCFLISFGQKPNNTPLALNDTISISYKISFFDASEHSVERCEIENWTGICLIDNQQVFGTDWEMPCAKFDYLTLVVNNQEIALNTSSLYNPNNCELLLRKDQFQIVPNEGGYLLLGSFSDGAGFYSVEWKIVKSNSIRTCIKEN